jgi:hypothetical protein
MRSWQKIVFRINAIVFAFVIGFGGWLGWKWRERKSVEDASDAIGGCFLHYRITDQSLRVQTPGGVIHLFEGVISGDNLVESIGKRDQGPIPPGVYQIFTRDHGKPTYGGHPAFLLDAMDAQPGNDRIDGFPTTDGGGRSAFRIHGGDETDGCLVTEAIDEIVALLLPHRSLGQFDIYSRPPDSGRSDIKRFTETEPGVWESAPEDGKWELFEQEHRIGLLWVTP